MLTREGIERTSSNPFRTCLVLAHLPLSEVIGKLITKTARNKAIPAQLMFYCTQLICTWSHWAAILWKAPCHFNTFIHKAKELKKNDRAPWQKTRCPTSEQNTGHFCKLFPKSVTRFKEKNRIENLDNGKGWTTDNNWQWKNAYAVNKVLASLTVTADLLSELF